MKLIRVYHVTEEEAKEKSLYYLDRFEAVTDTGHTIGSTLPDSDTIPTTKNWKL